MAEHPYLKGYEEELKIEATEAGTVDVSSFGFLNETAKYVAWLQPSVWNSNYMMAVFSPVPTVFLVKK